MRVNPATPRSSSIRHSPRLGVNVGKNTKSEPSKCRRYGHNDIHLACEVVLEFGKQVKDDMEWRDERSRHVAK